MKIDKRTHTVEEIDELKSWFQEHENQLPQAMQIDSSAFAPNLKETVTVLLEQAYTCCGNSKMQGPIWILKKIKENIEEKEQ